MRSGTGDEKTVLSPRGLDRGLRRHRCAGAVGTARAALARPSAAVRRRGPDRSALGAGAGGTPLVEAAQAGRPPDALDVRPLLGSGRAAAENPQTAPEAARRADARGGDLRLRKGRNPGDGRSAAMA